MTDPIVTELESAIAGRYLLERELGRGGMGAVFLARDLKLDRPVAIKVLPPELAVRPELRERFLRETRTAASFSHPNIVSVHSVEETPGLLFFVMGYIEGETLTQRVKRQGPLPVPEALRLLQEVAWALSYAHGRGVVHRDIKPDNVLLERSTGRALVMDFGIARSVAASGLTQVGEAIGTPHFMSPEQAAGDKVDGRSDLYSLGVVGYFAVSGRLPFDGESAQAVMVAHISQPVVPVTRFRPDLPAALSAAIDKCLAKSPDERFASGEELVESLAQVKGRQVDVHPAIRVWTVRADQWFRNGLILALVLPQFIQASSQRAKLIFVTVIVSMVVPLLWAQIPVSMRELARQGFSYADLRTGVVAIDAEREAVTAALQADPRFRQRRRRRWIMLLGGFVGSIAAIPLLMATGYEDPPGNHHLPIPALVALVLVLCFLMTCIVFAAATLASSGRMERRMHRLWTGWLGKSLFRLATWRLKQEEASPSASASSRGAITLLDTLPSPARKRLSKARGVLQSLEDELEKLDQRDRDLESAANEAKLGATTAPGLGNERQKALLADIEKARQGVSERRIAVLSTLENVRLSMVRVKSSIGTADDVERELSEASRLLAG